ncbi:hypothetical protein ACFVWN_01040 [Nocardiopsis flavescens]|uniref:hypothetical protein n=1 Tax=Nocardiopsis flavescens TaxID=758803 RepID=UPI00364AA1A7
MSRTSTCHDAPAPGMSPGLYIPDVMAPGALIGFRANGSPILVQFGAALADLDDWTPIEYDSDVWSRVMMESVIEREAVPVPMRTRTKSVPRSEGMRVRFGRTYVDDDSERSSYFLKARKITSRLAIDEDDLADAEMIVDVLGVAEDDYAISYATLIDHACLGVTGTESEVENDERPFTSVYRALRTSQVSNPNLGYAADDHYVAWDGTTGFSVSGPDGESFYEKASLMLKHVETSRYWSSVDALVIAHPAFRDTMRMATNSQGDPIFRESAGVDRSGNPYDTLFTTRIAWSHGARTHATASQDPQGNPLIFYGNRRALRKGDREGPRSLFSQARAQDDADEAAIKFRTRRGFALAHPKAWSVMEHTPGS